MADHLPRTKSRLKTTEPPPYAPAAYHGFQGLARGNTAIAGRSSDLLGLDNAPTSMSPDRYSSNPGSHLFQSDFFQEDLVDGQSFKVPNPRFRLTQPAGITGPLSFKNSSQRHSSTTSFAVQPDPSLYGSLPFTDPLPDLTSQSFAINSQNAIGARGRSITNYSAPSGKEVRTDEGYYTVSSQQDVSSVQGTIVMRMQDQQDLFSPPQPPTSNYPPPTAASLPPNVHEVDDHDGLQSTTGAATSQPFVECECPHPSCKTRITSQSMMNKHDARHRGIYPCQIPSCPRSAPGKGFGTTNDRDRHHENKHKEHFPTFKVDKCFAPGCKQSEKIWTRPDNFKWHVENVHSGITKKGGKDDPAKQAIRDDLLAQSALWRLHYLGDQTQQQPQQTHSNMIAPVDMHTPGSILLSSAPQTPGNFAEQRGISYKRQNTAFGMQPFGDPYRLQHLSHPKRAQLANQVKFTDPQFGQYYSPQIDISTPAVQLDSAGTSRDAFLDTVAQQSSFTKSSQQLLFPSHSMAQSGQRGRSVIQFPQMSSDVDLSTFDAQSMVGDMYRDLHTPSAGVKYKALTAPDTDRASRDDLEEVSPLPMILASSRGHDHDLSGTGDHLAVNDMFETKHGPRMLAVARESSRGGKASSRPSEDPLQSLPDFLARLDEYSQRDIELVQKRLATALQSRSSKHSEASTEPALFPGQVESRQPESVTGSDGKQQYRCRWPGCARLWASYPKWRKHFDRHLRPYACTFASDDCSKRFGSVSDWLRHETQRHLQQQCWRCDLKLAGENISCNQVFFIRQKMLDHLINQHQIPNSAVEKQMERRRIGSKHQKHYWCGFCRQIQNMTQVGVLGDNERTAHMRKHFKEGQSMDDWLLIEGHLTMGQAKASTGTTLSSTDKYRPSKSQIIEGEDEELYDSDASDTSSEEDNVDSGTTYQAPPFPADWDSLRPYSASPQVSRSLYKRRRPTDSDRAGSSVHTSLTGQGDTKRQKRQAEYVKCCKCPEDEEADDGIIPVRDKKLLSLYRRCPDCKHKFCDACKYSHPQLTEDMDRETTTSDEFRTF